MTKGIPSRFSPPISAALNVIVNSALMASVTAQCEDETHNDKLSAIYDQMADMGEHGCQAFISLLVQTLTLGAAEPQYAAALLEGLVGQHADGANTEARDTWLKNLMKEAPLGAPQPVEDAYIKPTPFDDVLRGIVGTEKEKE
jgi:hypothetical protein